MSSRKACTQPGTMSAFKSRSFCPPFQDTMWLQVVPLRGVLCHCPDFAMGKQGNQKEDLNVGGRGDIGHRAGKWMGRFIQQSVLLIKFSYLPVSALWLHGDYQASQNLNWGLITKFNRIMLFFPSQNWIKKSSFQLRFSCCFFFSY